MDKQKYIAKSEQIKVKEKKQSELCIFHKKKKEEEEEENFPG